MSKSPIITAASGTGLDLATMRRSPTHPGEIFRLEYREAADPPVSQRQAAIRMGMSVNRLNEIETGKRAVSPETAILFAALVGTSAEFWMTLQMRYDLWHAMHRQDAPRLAGDPIGSARRSRSRGARDAAVHSAKPAR